VPLLRLLRSCARLRRLSKPFVAAPGLEAKWGVEIAWGPSHQAVSDWEARIDCSEFSDDAGQHGRIKERSRTCGRYPPIERWAAVMRSPWVFLASLILAFANWSPGCGIALAQVPISPPEPCPDPCPPAGRDPVKSACPDELDFYMRPPRCPWYVMGDGMAMRRDDRGRFDAATVNTRTAVALSTADLDMDLRSGARVLVGRTLGECLQIEGVYFFVSEWDKGREIRNTAPNDAGGTGNLFSPFTNFGDPPLIGLDYNNFAGIRYASSLDNVELNVRRALPIRPGRLAASILVGVRYMDLPEQFQYRTESSLPAPNGAINEVRVDTDNALLGPQIGAMLEFYAENRWWINFEIKGAVCNNRAGQGTFYRYTEPLIPTFTFEDSRKEDVTAFVGDLSLTFVYRWSPFFTTRLGYQAIWLDGLALAAENFNRDINILTQGPAQLQAEGRAVYHGPFAGIMLSW